MLYNHAGRLPNGDGAAVAGVGIAVFDDKGNVTFNGLNDYGGLNMPFPVDTFGDYWISSIERQVIRFL